ncbi:RmlC-like cupin domain-containing protein [Aspergillus recurvatus]
MHRKQSHNQQPSKIQTHPQPQLQVQHQLQPYLQPKNQNQSSSTRKQSAPSPPNPSPPPTTTTSNNLTWRTLLSTSPPHLTPSSNICAGLASCPPHTGKLALHRHTQAEIYYITSGRGIVSIEGIEHEVSAGSVLFIPGDAEHGVVNRGGEALEWFYAFPTAGFGDVVYRFSGEGR